MRVVGLAFNYTEDRPEGSSSPFYAWGDRAPLVTDGTVQTYRLSLDDTRMGKWEGPWTHLAIWFNSQNDAEAVALDILSVRVIPREAEYAGDRVGVRTEQRSNALRRTLYTHAPGRLEYHVKVPDAGRLDVGLGVLRGNAPVTFAITATQQDGAAETLLEETYADQDHWAQRSVDLSHLAGQSVTLALEAEAERAGTVALWAAPTVSGARTTDKPNVVFYIIDGGAADLMSVYGYNRRTTPNLERLAAEGAVFERAYSNSSWTKVSTPSFMTSLQNSVLGGLKSESDPLPEQAVTMAQHMHGAGYQTAVYAANPFAGTISSLDRGADALRESWTEFSYFDDRRNQSVSSTFLHGSFWRWRKAYPGEPYWVHFQTTDVHYPWKPVAPFAGLFISPELRERYNEWQRQLVEAGGGRGGGSPDSAAFAETGISPVAHFNARRRLYDETMAHQDHQLGRLVERLKAAGEWQHTLLIVAADHSQWSALLRDPSWPRWGPILSSSVSRVPLIIVWPGRVAGGQRFSQPVSMIDMLPTILDLVGLPLPEVMQGQSLAPLLLGEEGWEPRPVILDEFGVEDTGELSGSRSRSTPTQRDRPSDEGPRPFCFSTCGTIRWRCIP
jgi:arylsulfatase A-like enzyme